MRHDIAEKIFTEIAEKTDIAEKIFTDAIIEACQGAIGTITTDDAKAYAKNALRMERAFKEVAAQETQVAKQHRIFMDEDSRGVIRVSCPCGWETEADGDHAMLQIIARFNKHLQVEGI